MKYVDNMKALAERGHAGQLRKDAKTDYVAHPRAVVDLLGKWNVSDGETLAIAWGHDLLEDTAVTEAEIRRAGGKAHGAAILAGIKALTRDRIAWPDKKEWLKHVARTAPPAALLVKAADRICNTRDFLALGDPAKARDYLAQGAPVFALAPEGEKIAAEVKALQEEIIAAAADIDSIALEYNGYAIKTVLFPKEECMACCDAAAEKTLRLNRNRYFLRSSLFGFQRYFGKWGGERVPDWHRQYSVYYFVFLQSYRVHLPRCVQVFRFSDHPIVPDNVREKIAAKIRNLFIQSLPDRTPVENIPEMAKHGFDGHYVANLSLPEKDREPFVLALSYDARLIADGGSDVEIGPNHGSAPPEERTLRFATETMQTALGKSEYSLDESENGMVFNLLAVELLRKRYLMDSVTLQYAHFMLLYLHLYRTHIPSFVRVEPHATRWESIPFETKETIAAKYRRILAEFREKESKRDYEQAYGEQPE